MSDTVDTPVATADEVEATGSKSFGDAFRLLGRVLLLRATKQELLALNSYDLVLGLLFTWIVGIGRYWDNPRAEVLQQLGVGSVVYVFLLATFMWLIVLPLIPRNWSWFRVLTFITLTSPPALLYAIPVQMIFPEPGLDTANTINLFFLGVVSVWRIVLMYSFVSKTSEMGKDLSSLALSLPILGIIVGVTSLNLDRAVFNIMGGFNEENASPNDDIYAFMFLLTMVSFITFIPVLLAYIITAAVRIHNYRQSKKPPVSNSENVDTIESAQ